MKKQTQSPLLRKESFGLTSPIRGRNYYPHCIFSLLPPQWGGLGWGFFFLIFFFFPPFGGLKGGCQTQQWATPYNGTANNNDHATALVIDASGNVYVTGYTTASDGTKDYVTIKYNNSGVQQWANVYNAGGNGGDAIPSALKVDASGNVYVTGYAKSLFNLDDYATIKYDSNGNQQWVKTYNGPNNSNDHAAGLVLDANSNVYVTGYIRTNDGGVNYGTVKYDSNGNQLWDWQLNGASNSDDYGTAIALDPNNYLLVAGWSYDVFTSFDYLVTKYNLASPSSPWPYPSTTSYDGGSTADILNAMTVDAMGNIYVTGQAGSDYATVKYNSSGVQQWANKFNGSGNGADNALAIAVDASGNVYVTGSATNSSGNTDYVTLRYNSSGTQQWASIYNGSGNNNDSPKAISLDANGNIYVTGSSTNSSGNQEYHTVKYDANGNQQWDIPYNGTGNGNDNAVAVAADASGNIYVTGFAKNTNDDFVTIKYSQQTTTVTITPSNVTCNGLCNGTATANATGGTAPYNYLWSNGITTSAATGLCAGTYTVSVTDATPNPAVTAAVSITQPSPLVVSLPPSQAICAGNCVTLSAAISGGTPAYTYYWSPNGQTTSSIVVCPTVTITYTLNVIDANGCTTSAALMLTVNPPPVVTVSSSNDTICIGQCATLTASGGGGYSWSTGATWNPIYVCPSASSTYTYTVTGFDANGCTNSAATTVTMLTCPTGISEEGEENSFSVYPNPSNGMFNVQWIIDNGNTSTIIIYNVLGEKVYSEKILNPKSLILNLNMPDGIYFVKILEGEQLFIQKLILEKE